MSALPHFADHSPLDAIMSRVNEIAVLPHVVYKVLELSGSADSSAAEMERAIVVDPGFSSRILALANSAFMGLPKKVSSIKEAILYCGLKNVRELAMTVGVYDMFVGKSDRESLRRRGWWRHSVDSAVIAKHLATEVRVLAPDEAYTCGLLHLIGKSLLDRFGGEDYQQVDNLIDAGFADVIAEREVFGVAHHELAMAAAAKWGFPAALFEGLNYVDAPHSDDSFQSHRAAVAISTRIAKYVIDGKAGKQQSLELPNWALQNLSMSAENTPQILEGAILAVGQASVMH
jgi:HD-like signal output (HDOD) protein